MQPQRPPRRDKGDIRLSSRDLTILTWIGDQYAVRLDNLQVLLGRTAQQTVKERGRVSESTARQVLERWQHEGLVATRKILAHEPLWVWLTSYGLRQMGLSHKYVQPTVALLGHYHDVNQVRLRIEYRYKKALDHWRGERLLRQEYRDSPRFRVPDAEIVTNKQEVVAIEIERTLKSRQRVTDIIELLQQQYKAIWYFATPVTKPVIEAAVANYPQFKVYDLVNSTE